MTQTMRLELTMTCSRRQAQPVVLGRTHVLITADDQHARIIDDPSPESGLHRGRLGQVLELVEPVDHLGVPMVEARAPLPRRLVPVPDEQTARPRVLELDEGASARDRVGDRQIATGNRRREDTRRR